jgi:hypothetical protein
MSDFSQFVLFVLVALGGMAWVINVMPARSCAIYAEETGIKTKWRHFDSCYIETPTGFMRWDEFKARATTKEQEAK